ncbi:Potassium channel domain [Trinorchestia longiramus]|nr:Potassium channel domain [Trinorchestia longiramus]
MELGRNIRPSVNSPLASSVVDVSKNGSGGHAEAVEDQNTPFINALFYCVTVITTIGYGHIVPSTFEGKLSTIFYAVLGIPLFLLTVSNIGNLMASLFRFSYTRLCCGNTRRGCCNAAEDDEETSSVQTGKPEKTQKGELPPFVPPPKYSPKRKKMLISPPISATLHRGSDLPHSPMADSKNKTFSYGKNMTNSASPSPIYHRNQQLTLAPEALEARKLVAECAAYASSAIPGFTPDQSDLKYDPKVLELNRQSNVSHDYDLLSNTLMLEPPTPTASLSTSSPVQSTPSSPLSRDAPLEGWNATHEPRSLSVSKTGNSLQQEGGSSSSQSTRAASPSWVSLSTGSPRTESAVTWADEEAGINYEPKMLKRPPGKTLVVYNTMSGDALQQQSKLARKMEAMHRKKHKTHQRHESTMFVDPATGQTVDSNLMGLDIRPIPPKARPKDVRVPIPIVLAFVACYVMVGALIFRLLEGWELFDAAYFSFITLSTIGFGDFVPGKSLGYETLAAQMKLLVSSLYLLFGLAILAMSFNLVQEEVVLMAKSVAQYLGLLKE